MSDLAQTPYERLGGSPFFARLVDTFYEGVSADPEVVRDLVEL